MAQKWFCKSWCGSLMPNSKLQYCYIQCIDSEFLIVDIYRSHNSRLKYLLLTLRRSRFVLMMMDLALSMEIWTKVSIDSANVIKLSVLILNKEKEKIFICIKKLILMWPLLSCDCLDQSDESYWYLARSDFSREQKDGFSLKCSELIFMEEVGGIFRLFHFERPTGVGGGAWTFLGSTYHCNLI